MITETIKGWAFSYSVCHNDYASQSVILGRTLYYIIQKRSLYMDEDDSQNYREPEISRLHLMHMAINGDVMAEFEGGTINVFGGIPEEIVDAEIYRYRRRKKRVISAMVVKVVRPSKHRVHPPCKYFGPCSGCQWQHIQYPHQLRLKRKIVEDQLMKYPMLSGVSVRNIIPDANQLGYRNHARFAVRYGGQIGFSNRITRRFVKIDQCKLMDRKINESLQKLQGRVSETSNLSVRVGINTSDTLIQPKLANKKIDVKSGQQSYREILNRRVFKVASPSFFQTNTKQAEKMIDIVGEALELKGDEILVDAYAGVGTFALSLASKVKKVIAIESSLSAVNDAIEFGSDVVNVEFRLGKTEEILKDIGEGINALILDPPRVGCHVDTLKAVLDLKPSRVVYVSCDPQSMSRDMNVLAEGGYEITGVDLLDMFPQTYHIECIVSLNMRS